jgi:hypothetical protein
VTAQTTSAPARPRADRNRRLVTALIVLAMFVGWALADSYGAQVRGHTWPGFAVIAVYCVVLGFYARRVSYRRRDVLFVLAGPPGMFWLSITIVYRLTLLPYRDWAPRPDETGWVQILDPERPGRLLYLATGTDPRKTPGTGS